MSSADDFDGADFRISDEAGEPQGAPVETLLVEALMHVLIEKGLLTRNDALSVVQTVAQVKRGILDEGRVAKARTQVEIWALQRIYRSFEALSDRPGAVPADGENIFPLRPPVHGDDPEFPRDD